ncbi:MAG TPA: sulfatase [Thermoanaerobaculia bacterium]|nr:sulfatase [Thermoanaerobaculia bacterium]
MTLGLALAVLGGCGGSGAASRPPGPSRPPLPRATRGYVLISIDTLRADHLGCYGYSRPTSPFIDSLARRATRFEEAYAQYPSTLVSHMSIFTGLYPREHGVFPPNSVLSPSVETLPEVFQRHGFRTAGFTEGGFVSGRFGFRRGFDVFVSRDRVRRRPVAGTFRRGLDFLESLGPKARFFLFLHTYAVHTPYDAPEEYRRQFWAGGPPAGAIPADGPDLTRQNQTGERPPPAVIDWLEARYDAGIRQTDEVLRGFFADLERLGLADQVTVVITADHGEEFMEHGLFNHTQLYRETLRVPLLVVHPDQRSAVLQSGVVQLIDLAPTLYELARVRPGRQPTGASLARLLGRPAPPLAGSAWAEAQDGMRAVYRGEHRRLESLLLFDPPAQKWFPRRVAFDAPPGTLAFDARSFARRRRLVVSRGREAIAAADLTPEWAPVRATLGGPERIVLEADGCTEPEEEGSMMEPRCYAFQVKGRRLTRVELYDVSRDPWQRRDLFRERQGVARALLRDLMAFHPAPVAAARAPPLDPGLAQSLRSLGYLK